MDGVNLQLFTNGRVEYSTPFRSEFSGQATFRTKGQQNQGLFVQQLVKYPLLANNGKTKYNVCQERNERAVAGILPFGGEG